MEKQAIVVISYDLKIIYLRIYLCENNGFEGKMRQNGLNTG
jgi:hypothetical protein